MNQLNSETPAEIQKVNVSFDAPICPSHHDVWWQTDGDAPAHSVFIHPYHLVDLHRGEGASRFTAPKLIGGGTLIIKNQERQRGLGEDREATEVDFYLMR